MLSSCVDNIYIYTTDGNMNNYKMKDLFIYMYTETPNTCKLICPYTLACSMPDYCHGNALYNELLQIDLNLQLHIAMGYLQYKG